jgi:uncharacterized protein (DUF924 family)
MTGDAGNRTSEQIDPQNVLDFWFALSDAQYFKKDPALDMEITERFQCHHEAAKRGAYDHWQETPIGMAALIVLLDQFARNIYRESPDAFAADAKALSVAKRAVARGADMELPAAFRRWVYLPFEHSERMEDQERCVELCERSGLDEVGKWARIHAVVIKKFGRFPHRNAVLGRETSPEEQLFLDADDFSG